MNKKVLWLAVIILLSLHSAAQQNTITIKFSKTPLSEIIGYIGKQHGITFAYSSSQVDLSKPVSVDIKSAELETILTKIFTGLPIGFSITGSNVVLYYTSKYKVTLSGYLREKGTGELIIGGIINSKPLLAGTTSNAYGFYSLTLPADSYTFYFNFIGYKPVELKLNLTQSQSLNIELDPLTNLSEVIVNAESNKPHIHLNSTEIPISEIRNIPTILGEKDVLKYLVLSSGVQKGSEGNAYLYVRGGAHDQNLIMIDDAVIYNSYHFLGLSSLFSGNELRKAELIKGGFSSRYGGRLSSVLDMSMKDGNRERYSAEATAGLISSRILVEGPIVKNKSSFLISARKCYLDKAINLISDGESVLNYSYYDVHAKLSTDIGLRNRLMLSGYIGNDFLQTNTNPGITSYDDGIGWGNKAASLRWNHQFSSKLFLNTSAVYSYYKTRTAFADIDPSSGFKNSSSLQSTIQDLTLKADLEYAAAIKHRFKFGAGGTRHFFEPITELNNSGSVFTKTQKSNSNEFFAYGEWLFKPTQKLQLISGLRYSGYSCNTTYHRIEPRFKATLNLGKNWSAGASYSLMNQYLHLLSTFSGMGFPNDAWISSDENLKPQRAHLYTTGLSKNNLFGKNITINIEFYYKQIENAVSVKEGYTFFNILPAFQGIPQAQNWSDITTQGTGESKGAEFSIKKEGKHIDFWVSYTLSRTTFVFNEINNGKRYVANYDRTHDVGIYMSYKSKKHWLVSASWVYGTGSPITLPQGEYYAFSHEPGGGLTAYQSRFNVTEKNTFRMRDYHKLDLSIQYEHKLTRAVKSTIELSFYNAYNRANPYAYQIETHETKQIRVLRQLSLFPIIPALSWTIKF